MYALHRLRSWIYFATLSCALAVPLKADIHDNGVDVLGYARFDDPCQNVNVTITYTYSVSGGNPTSGSASWNTSRGNFEFFDVYPDTLFKGCTLSYTITPTTVSATPYNSQQVSQTAEGGNPNLPAPYSWNPSYGYSATTPNPCGVQPGEENAIQLGVTNFGSTPMLLPNGQTLQPGQGTDYLWNPPLGSSNSITFQSLNQDDQYQDSGSYTITNGWNNAYPPGWVSSSNLSYTPPIGPDGNALASGGGVVWDSTNTTPANNGTLQSGFELLNNDQLANQLAMNGDFSNLLNRLNAQVPVTFTNQLSVTISNGSGGSNISVLNSNVWVQNWPSNFNSASNVVQASSNVWVMNFPTNIDTNTLISMVMSHTNLAYGVMGPVQADASSLLGQLPSSLGDVAGSPQEQDVQIGPSTAPITIPLAVLPSAVSTPFNAIRGLIAWFIVVVLIIWNYKTLFDCFYRVMSVPQAQGADAGIFSQLGANAATAIISATLIVAIASALPVIAVGFLAGELAFLGGTSSPLNFFAAMGWAYQFLSQYIPIYTMFSAFGMRVVFYFGLRFFEMIALAVVKLIVGI